MKFSFNVLFLVVNSCHTLLKLKNTLYFKNSTHCTIYHNNDGQFTLKLLLNENKLISFLLRSYFLSNGSVLLSLILLPVTSKD